MAKNDFRYLTYHVAFKSILIVKKRKISKTKTCQIQIDKIVKKNHHNEPGHLTWKWPEFNTDQSQLLNSLLGPSWYHNSSYFRSKYRSQNYPLLPAEKITPEPWDSVLPLRITMHPAPLHSAPLVHTAPYALHHCTLHNWCILHLTPWTPLPALSDHFFQF